MATTLPDTPHSGPANRPLALGSSAGLGAVFTAAMLKNATMTELAEARAKRGYCPNCQAQRLRHIGGDGGMVFRKCAECGTVAVLGV